MESENRRPGGEALMRDMIMSVQEVDRKSQFDFPASMRLRGDVSKVKMLVWRFSDQYRYAPNPNPVMMGFMTSGSSPDPYYEMPMGTREAMIVEEEWAILWEMDVMGMKKELNRTKVTTRTVGWLNPSKGMQWEPGFVMRDILPEALQRFLGEWGGRSTPPPVETAVVPATLKVAEVKREVPKSVLGFRKLRRGVTND